MNKPQINKEDPWFSTDKLKQLVEFYGAKNLVFVMEVAGFDRSTLGITAPMGFGFVSDSFTSVEAFKIDETSDKLSDNYKISLVSDSVLVPKQRPYLFDLTNNIRSGYCNIYVETEDGYDPVFVTMKGVEDPQESKVRNFIESIRPNIESIWLNIRYHITN